MSKPHLHADETGLDTRGELYVVASIITEGDLQPIRERLQAIAQETGKIRPKWNKTFPEVRLAYMRRVLQEANLFARLSFHYYVGEGNQDYLEQTVSAIAAALIEYVETENITECQATILIDGLTDTALEQARPLLRSKLYASGKQINTRKIRGIADDNDLLMQLADAVAGFVRDARTGKDKELAAILEKALRDGAITEV